MWNKTFLGSTLFASLSVYLLFTPDLFGHGSLNLARTCGLRISTVPIFVEFTEVLPMHTKKGWSYEISNERASLLETYFWSWVERRRASPQNISPKKCKRFRSLGGDFIRRCLALQSCRAARPKAAVGKISYCCLILNPTKVWILFETSRFSPRLVPSNTTTFG